jgi:phosphoglycerate dehydrogenase-like enzyme
MPKIAILDDYTHSALALADWKSLPQGFETVVFDDTLVDHDALVKRLAGFDVICAMRERTPFPASLFARLPDLKLFMTSGMRNRAVDFAAATAQGVVCCGTESYGNTTVEHAVALISALAHNVAHDDRMMRAGKWQTRVGVDVGGQTLGLLGLGRLGTRTAKVMQALGMKTIAWSQNLTAERAAEAGCELVSKDELFRRSDFLSIHLILGDRSRGLVGAHELSLMKPTARLVNTSRGPIVDEAALIAALTEGRIAGAAVDVYDVEPLPASHPLRSLDNLLMTPHTGYVSEQTYRSFYSQMVENIKAWHAGAPVRVITG